jgi:hypothetical protein
MPIRFYCPECKKPLEIDDIDAGKLVVCFYCNKNVTAPETSDPSLVNPGVSADANSITGSDKKSPTPGIVGLVAGLLIILGIIVLLGWLYTQFAPEARTPEFAKMTPAEQKALLNSKAQELKKLPAIGYTVLAISLVAIIGFLSSIIALVKNAGRKFAVPGLIINGAFLLLMLMKFLPKK